MTTVVLEAGGLVRASTAPTLEAFLRRHPAVHRAEASYLSETVTVAYDESRISEAALRGLIEKCGFHCQGQVMPSHVCAPAPGMAAAHRPPALAHDRARHVVAQEPASARDAVDVSTETSAMAHEMGHGPGMGMEGMVRDMRRRFWVTFILAIAVTLYSPLATDVFGHWMEMRARAGASDAMRALLDLAPPMATVIREGRPVEVPTAEVQVGDVVLVRPGNKIAVAQEGGVGWLRDHLRLSGFDPIEIDGRDPAAFAWARSNRLNATLDLLKHRVTAPEPGIAEAVDGAVITALNEEAVACAALGNKGGINLIVTYEAFAVKMLGAVRQELIFSRHQREAGFRTGWISVPLVSTSHTWENGKNEQSHQDPTLAEALLGEMADTARVVFPVDWNSTVAAIRAAYATRGQIWNFVVPKQAVPDRFTPEQAERLAKDGALRLRGDGRSPLVLLGIGAYQLTEVLRAAERLEERGISTAVVYALDPGRLRVPRDEREGAATAPPAIREELFPATALARVIVGHTRPEPMLGVLRAIDSGPKTTRALGFINHGGTLDVAGMLFANRCTWAHALAAAAEALDRRLDDLLTPDEVRAIRGVGDPAVILRR